MTPPRALLFDWDNTLVDTWSTIHRALAVTFEAMGREPWTLEEVRANVRQSARESFPALFGARAEEATRLFYEAFARDHLAHLRERAGAGAMLAELAADPALLLGVVSNKTGHLLRVEAEALGWQRHFHRLVGATDAPRDKPARDPVELALADSGRVPGPEVWFVGDTDIDLLCAVNAGCTPILIREAPPAPGEFAGHEPAAYAADFAALAALVRGR
ncbi:HAD family hydrolase [Phormidium willei BDU 130791]|nr:HAD family hydrolase [Phormidium willei BDU 130791]